MFVHECDEKWAVQSRPWCSILCTVCVGLRKHVEQIVTINMREKSLNMSVEVMMCCYIIAMSAILLICWHVFSCFLTLRCLLVLVSLLWWFLLVWFGGHRWVVIVACLSDLLNSGTHTVYQHQNKDMCSGGQFNLLLISLRTLPVRVQC